MAESQEDKADVSQEARFAKWKRAFQILTDAVKENRLRDFSEYHDDEPLESRWEVYKRDHPGDVSLIIVTSGLFGKLYWEFLLLGGVIHIVGEVERLLSQPNADKLFALSSENEIKEIGDLHARQLTSNYIKHLPVAMYQALNQALDDTIRGYSKNVVEPTFKEHWKSLGIPEGFTLLPESELQKYDRQIEDLRKIFVGDKRPKLTEEQLSRLTEQYQTLRNEYQAARRFHNQAREAFFRSNITVRNKDEAWRKAWSSMASDMFPSLDVECLGLLADLNYLPYELATRHLARLYRYSFEYMRNLLKSPKKALRKKRVEGKKKATKTHKGAKKPDRP